MSNHEKLIHKILSGRQDNSINFLEIVNVLKSFNFSLRINGSHHIFCRSDIEEIINIQPKGAGAKPYQVKQIRDIIVKYHLEANHE